MVIHFTLILKENTEFCKNYATKQKFKIIVEILD